MNERELHIQQVKDLGWKYAYSRLKRLENIAHKNAEDYCNGVIESDEYDNRCNTVLDSLKKGFNGKLPDGLFINGDPRGYTLKLESTNQIITYQDWGGYKILVPNFNWRE